MEQTLSLNINGREHTVTTDPNRPLLDVLREGLGPTLTEAMEFDDRQISNATFRRYRVPHFHDAPKIEAVLVDRPDLTSVGAGETPIIVIAPAVASAACQATGNRVRQMPVRLSDELV